VHEDLSLRWFRHVDHLLDDVVGVLGRRRKNVFYVATHDVTK
jgi:hypothetical protein